MNGPVWILTLLLAACAAWNPFSQAEVIVAHVIPHSHCDPGWLNTFEGYYGQEVKMILDGVMQALSNDDKKKFVWAEISFFSRWYETLSDQQKQSFKRLVDGGQLEFVGGGWVQNDEANPDYPAIINQVTEGHQYLLKNFGVAPRIAWQIDPFGHSAVTPSLFALMGYEALVINRIHHQLKRNWRGSKHLEFVWQGVDVGQDDATNETISLFTHVLFKHYSAVTGFDWEESAPPISDSSVGYRAQEFCKYIKERARAYRTAHLLVPFGDDFKFKRASYQFQQMDALIAHINANSATLGVKVVYSSLSDYFDAVQDTGVKFPVHRGDFFPYADNEDSYWTGYFTTRPTLKILSRRLERTLRSAEQLHAIVRSSPDALLSSERKQLSATHWEDIFKGIERARREHALFMHHDAITGTSRAEVVGDYENRINGASSQLFASTCRLLEHALTREPFPSPIFTPDGFTLTPRSTTSASFTLYPIMIYNSLAWRRKEMVSVLTSTPYVLVRNSSDIAVPSQVDHTFDKSSDIHPAKAVFRVHFLAELPPLGATTYFVRVYHKRDPTTATAALMAKRATTTVFSKEKPGHRRGEESGSEFEYAKVVAMDDPSAELSFENDLYKVWFSRSTSMLEKVLDKKTQPPLTLNLAQTFGRYSSSRSGAYIFRPDGQRQSEAGEPPSVIQLTRGPLMNTVASTTSNFQQISTRLVGGGDVELAGHIMLDHNVFTTGNSELIIAFTSDLRNDGKILTHNGLEFMPRERKGATPANLWPMVAGARLSGLTPQHTNTRFTVFTEHSMACGHQKDGALELTVHRNLNQDDGRGLSQAVADHSHVDIPLWLALDEGRSLLDFKRRSLRLNFPVQVFYHKGENDVDGTASGVEISDWVKTQFTEFSALKEPLPRNVHLLSLMGRDSISDDVILRLHHLGGRRNWVKDLRAVFADFLAPNELRTVSLSVNQVLRDGKPRIKFLVDEREEAEEWKPNGGQSAEEQDKQNSEEEGVFISQAALDKAKADAEARGGNRRLLALPSSPSSPSLRANVSSHQLQRWLVKQQQQQKQQQPYAPLPSSVRAAVQAAALTGGYFDHSAVDERIGGDRDLDLELDHDFDLDHDQLEQEQEQDEEEQQQEGQDEVALMTDLAMMSRRLLEAKHTTKAAGGNPGTTVVLRPGQIKSYVMRLNSPDQRTKEESVKPMGGLPNLGGHHMMEPTPEQIEEHLEQSESQQEEQVEAHGAEHDKHGQHYTVEGVKYWLPKTHTHTVMPAHGPRYLPSRTEYVVVILLTCGVVAYFLARLQILSCRPAEDGDAGSMGTAMRKERRYVKSPPLKSPPREAPV